jgi:PAS domain S-box-containing protein
MSENSIITNLEQKIQDLESELAEAFTVKNALQDSEDRYNRLLENHKEEFLFFSHDPDGRFTYVSPSYANILGYTSEEYRGKNSFDLWTSHPLNIEAERSTRMSCKGIRQPPYEMEIYHKDGSTRRFVVIELPIFDEEGKLSAVEGTSRDITEKRKNEEQLELYRLKLEDLVKQRTQELETSQKQLSDIIDFSPDPIYVIDTNENIIVWNRAMVALTEITRGSALGNHYKPLLKNFYKSKEPLLIQMVLDGIFEDKSLLHQLEADENRNFEISKSRSHLFSEKFIPSINDDSGGYIWVTAAPILDANNHVAGAVESIRDVTQIKQAERKILQNERRLSTLFSNLPGMAYRINILSTTWQVEFVSEGSRDIFGHDPSFFINRGLKDFKNLIHPDDLESLVESAISAIKTQQPFECEYRVITADGESKWVFNKAQLINFDNSNQMALEGIMSDFTVYKKMEERLRNENFLLRSTIRDRYKFQNIIGNCPALQDVFDLIVNSASSEDNVFIYGESGTGKELVAHAIHETSDRKDKAFVAVNCSAIPENLIESEFFGTSKGAFTGAHADKAGYLTVADGGTLFLDEIGDISPHLQVKLLRAIDDGGFSPVGSKRIIRPNLRIIAASNKNLEEMMHNGDIRQDFFFRIHVIPIHLPPLRERDDDIFILINYFLKKFSPSDSLASLTRDELEILKKHNWPGNIRELQNVLRRYIALKNLDFMRPHSQASDQKESLQEVETSPDRALKEMLIIVEKDIIYKKLQQVKWNKSRAARDLGISRKTLFRKMKTCGLS